MEILKRAEELGKLIRETPEYRNVVLAGEIQSKDEEAVKLIDAYNEERNQIAQRMQKEELSDEQMGELRLQLEKSYGKLLENTVISTYVKALDNFNELEQSVYKTISDTILGNQGGCASGGCSSCSSCSGCH